MEGAAQAPGAVARPRVWTIGRQVAAFVASHARSPALFGMDVAALAADLDTIAAVAPFFDQAEEAAARLHAALLIAGDDARHLIGTVGGRVAAFADADPALYRDAKFLRDYFKKRHAKLRGGT